MSHDWLDTASNPIVVRNASRTYRHHKQLAAYKNKTNKQTPPSSLHHHIRHCHRQAEPADSRLKHPRRKSINASTTTSTIANAIVRLKQPTEAASRGGQTLHIILFSCDVLAQARVNFLVQHGDHNVPRVVCNVSPSSHMGA